jgi:CheY-like chemotaxis protein
MAPFLLKNFDVTIYEIKVTLLLPFLGNSCPGTGASQRWKIPHKRFYSLAKQLHSDVWSLRKKIQRNKGVANMINLNESSIVVVDDDQGILDSFDAMLGDDYPLSMVDNGSEAIKLLSRQNPRLLFLDIKIPGPNGLEVLKWIRDNGIPTIVVIVTALHQDSYEEIARQYGIYRYLRKPLDVDEVEEIAHSVLH